MKKLIVLIIMALALTACGKDDPTILTGTYAMDFNGQKDEVFKIKEDGHGGFVAFDRGSKGWNPKGMPLKELTDGDKAKLGPNGSKAIGFHYPEGSFAIIKVPEGWTSGEISSKTGYLALTVLGPIELQKVK